MTKPRSKNCTAHPKIIEIQNIFKAKFSDFSKSDDRSRNTFWEAVANRTQKKPRNEPRTASSVSTLISRAGERPIPNDVIEAVKKEAGPNYGEILGGVLKRANEIQKEVAINLSQSKSGILECYNPELSGEFIGFQEFCKNQLKEKKLETLTLAFVLHWFRTHMSDDEKKHLKERGVNDLEALFELEKRAFGVWTSDANKSFDTLGLLSQDSVDQSKWVLKKSHFSEYLLARVFSSLKSWGTRTNPRPTSREIEDSSRTKAFCRSNYGKQIKWGYCKIISNDNHCTEFFWC